MNTAKPEVLYFYDTMCGWCYGFSPVIVRLQEELRDRYDFRVFNGGMVLGENEKPIGEMAGYISQALGRVEKMGGVKFGEPFRHRLAVGTYRQSSELPGIAHVLFKKLQPEQGVAFAAKLQKAYFQDGLDMNELTTYGSLVEEFGLAAEDFMEQLGTPAAKAAAYDEFKWVKEVGISGFPTLAVGQNGHYEAIAQGFQTYEILYAMLKGFKFD